MATIEKVAAAPHSASPSKTATVEEVAKRYNIDQFVTIALENEEETFMLSKALLCSTSEYFVRALEHGFKETTNHILVLPESKLETIRLFIYWLSEHRLPDFRKEVDSFPYASAEIRQSATARQESLVRLWCFADRFLIPKLQDEAMKQLLKLLRGYYARAEIIDLAFRMSSPGSALQLVILSNFLRNRHPDALQNAYGGLKYEEADIDRLGETPGLMSQFLRMVAKAKCGKYPCTCGKSCYHILQSEDHRYMVAE